MEIQKSREGVKNMWKTHIEQAKLEVRAEDKEIVIKHKEPIIMEPGKIYSLQKLKDRPESP